MTNRLMLALLPTLALSACGKDDAPSKKDPAGADSKNKDGTPKIDPALSWKEQRGPGFVVLAPRAPTEQKSKAPNVTQVTTYAGYQPEGFLGAFEIKVAELPKPTGEVDPLKILRDAVKEPKTWIPGTETDDIGSIVGTDPGMEAVYSGTDPKLGAFKMRLRAFYKNNILYTVWARYPADRKDLGPQAQSFVDSFKFAD